MLLNRLTSGACLGYRKDHVVPLACGGPDAPANMQWQTKADAKAKDKWETKGCAWYGGVIAEPFRSTLIFPEAAVELGGYSRICFRTRQP